jgi:hypothetical protein
MLKSVVKKLHGRRKKGQPPGVLKVFVTASGSAAYFAHPGKFTDTTEIPDEDSEEDDDSFEDFED